MLARPRRLRQHKAYGKKFNDYRKNKSTMTYVKALQGSAGFPADLIEIKMDGPNESRGF